VQIWQKHTTWWLQMHRKFEDFLDRLEEKDSFFSSTCVALKRMFFFPFGEVRQGNGGGVAGSLIA
jgi:hypothetical protein